MKKLIPLKLSCIVVLAILSFLVLCFVAYWEYLDYKFEQDPLYYYKPRICNYLDPETADSVAEAFNRRAKQLRDSLGRIPTTEEMMSVFPDNRSGDYCPKCKSTDVGRFVYGLRLRDSITLENERNGKIIGAGCTLSSRSPKYRCNNCSCEWGNHVKGEP